MRLTSEQIQQILEGAVEAIMQRDGCDRQTAMRAVEENGVQVNVRHGDEVQTLLIRFADKPAPFKAND